jgi:hypothetical protein
MTEQWWLVCSTLDNGFSDGGNGTHKNEWTSPRKFFSDQPQTTSSPKIPAEKFLSTNLENSDTSASTNMRSQQDGLTKKTSAPNRRTSAPVIDGG